MQKSNNILRLPQAIEKTGLSRSTIHRLIKYDDTFPRSFKLGSRSIGWIEAEIDAWIQGRVEASRQEKNQSSTQ